MAIPLETTHGIDLPPSFDFFRQKEQRTFEQVLQGIDGRPKQGALRVSVGLATNFADVSRLMQFARGFGDRCVLSSLPAQSGEPQQDAWVSSS